LAEAKQQQEAEATRRKAATAAARAKYVKDKKKAAAAAELEANNAKPKAPGAAKPETAAEKRQRIARETQLVSRMKFEIFSNYSLM
jgi:hypothetical protein